MSKQQLEAIADVLRRPECQHVLVLKLHTNRVTTTATYGCWHISKTLHAYMRCGQTCQGSLWRNLWANLLGAKNSPQTVVFLSTDSNDQVMTAWNTCLLLFWRTRTVCNCWGVTWSNSAWPFSRISALKCTCIGLHVLATLNSDVLTLSWFLQAHAAGYVESHFDYQRLLQNIFYDRLPGYPLVWLTWCSSES